MGQQKDWCSRRSTQVNTSYYLGQSSYLGRNRNTHPYYNQMKANVYCSPNQYTLSTFPSATDKTLKFPEKHWPFLYLKFTKVLQFSFTMLILKIVTLLSVCVTTVSVIRELLSISVPNKGDFVAGVLLTI